MIALFAALAALAPSALLEPSAARAPSAVLEPSPLEPSASPAGPAPAAQNSPNAANPAAPAPAANPQGNPGGSTPGGRTPPIQDVGDFYLLTFDEVEDGDGMKLEQFVKICQEVTRINFTYTKDTAGTLKTVPLRMFGPKRIPKSDFYSFFQIMMIINDFVCIKIGADQLSVVLIQSLQGQGGRGPQVRNDATYVQPEDIESYSDQPATLITTVIDLPNTDVRTLSNSMRTMFTDANTQQIIPVGNNSLIITGFGSNVASIVRMLHFVDEAAKPRGEQPEFELLKLEYAAADEIATLVEELLEASKRAIQGRAGAQPGQGATAPLQQGQGETKIMTDPRTNSLIVMAMPSDMPRIKELVARLDVDIVQQERTYHIYNLENVAADDLAKTLDDFIKDAQRVAPSGPGPAGGQRAAGGQAGGTTSGRNEIVVVADKVTNSLLIAANRTRFEEVRELISRLDHRQDQVLIETALVELSGQNSLNLGVELGGANLPGGFGVTNFGLSTFDDTNGDGVPDVRTPNVSTGVTAGILSGDSFNLPILIAALEGRRDSNVLNIPSVLVNNNGSAKVVSKDEQPTTQITATGVNGGTQENFRDYVSAGITMQISPTISASRYLRLKVSLEVSVFQGDVNGAIPPPKVTRTIDTTVNVPDGDTMVIGGIITDNKTKDTSQVPILGDIPILGHLFGRNTDSSTRTTLYFFVTPHILRDKDFADLAEVSYQKKLDAADTIGVDRIRVIDPKFGQSKAGMDLRGFEVPLYKSPARGEVDSNAVGMDPARMRELIRQEREKEEKARKQTEPASGGNQ